MNLKRKSIAEILLLTLIIGISIWLVNSRPVKADLDPDLNNDGIMDIKDISMTALSFGACPGDDLWNPEADFNGDEVINIHDLSFVAKYFGQLYAPILGSINPETITVTLQPGESINQTEEVTFICTFEYDLGKLELKASEGYETWLTSITPTEYINVRTNTDPYTFQITITVPECTLPGDHTFQIIAYTSGSQYMGEAHQNITVEVTPKFVIPEVPLGVILTLTSMIAALALYITLPKLRRSLKNIPHKY